MTKTYQLPEYEQHPIALALMPEGMSPEEFDAFCADCEERGIYMPATLYEGKVLDGWHRYRAAKRTNSPLKFTTYTGSDPAGYIASVNLMRRKLSSLQRALVGARLHRDHGLTQRQACKKLAISNEVITLVLKALDSKRTGLIKRIETDGDFTRGMLKEELEDAGLLRAKPKTEIDPTTLVNSVFAAGGVPFLSEAAMSRGAPSTQDTDGTEDDEDPEDDVEDLLGTDTGKGLKASKRAERKPQATEAQLMAERFHALMEDEKRTFLQMIWPVAKALVPQGAGKKPAAKKPKAS